MLDPKLIAQARQVDLLAYAERYTTLRRVAATGGGEYAGPCPLCGGRDRFRVQPARGQWWCRRCSDRWEDAIALAMRLTQTTFPEAVRALVGAEWPMATKPTLPNDNHSEPPNTLWQQRAQVVALNATQHLWSPVGCSTRAWLHARGLTDATLKRWQMGYLPTARREPAEQWGLDGETVYLSSGVVIPGEVAQTRWYLKVRRLARSANFKYLHVRGSRPALFMAKTLADADTVCVTEGELDALLLWQCLQADADLRRLAVVTLGSQANRLRPLWASQLTNKRLLLFFDQDEPGQRGAQTWQARFPNATNVRWAALHPGDKDLTDHHRHGGDLRALVRAAV